MKIWKNTLTLDGYDDGLDFTKSKNEANIALLGSKPIIIEEFPNLKGIFRAGIGKDNVPEREARKRKILIRYPSEQTVNIIFDETANFTCSLVFRMIYNKIGKIEPWTKFDRSEFSTKNLLVIGTGNIGGRVIKKMRAFMNVLTFDIIENNLNVLPSLIERADCITLHIPNSEDNNSFMNKERLGLMKDGAVLINTARGTIVDELALYDEIKNERLTAAFDVFWIEPYNGKLKEFYPDRFFMTPHVASTCGGFLTGCRESLDKLIIELQND